MRSLPSASSATGSARRPHAIARAISGAGSHFLFNQLPELYTSTERQDAAFPVQYLGANVPQAWAAGSVFTLLRTMLGFVPDARHGKLYVDPELPSWLPDLTVLDLRVHSHIFDIRFWREGEETKFEVLRGDPTLIERSRMGAAVRTTDAGAGAHRSFLRPLRWELPAGASGSPLSAE